MHQFGQIFMGLYLLLILLLSLYGVHRYWILYLYFRYYKWSRRAAPPVLTDSLPQVTIQLPIFNERYVVERLIDTVCALDYPRDLLEIQVLDDSIDDTCDLVRAKVEAMRGQGFTIEHRHRENRV